MKRLQTPILQVNADFVSMTFILPTGVGKTSRGTMVKRSEKILRHLRTESALSENALAEIMGVSSRAVEKQIDLLKKEGYSRRFGPAKGGYYQVLE